MATPKSNRNVQTALMSKMDVSVEDDLDSVILHIGSIDIRMPYQTALEMGESLRHCGRKAKRWAGDMSTSMRVIATLTDAETDERESQARRVIGATAIPRNDG